MKLCGIEFSNVLQASGATNFYGHGRGRGHGWWYHKILAPFGLRWNHSGVVTKTTTLLPRAGNMPLKNDGVTPKEWIPRCIVVNRAKQAVLNAVGLSGPGLDFLLSSGKWKEIRYPFFISIMSLAETREERHAEYSVIFGKLAYAKAKGGFRADFGVQVNLSCPNGGLDPDALIDEAVPTLECAGQYLPDTVPVMPKFGPEAHPESMLRIVKHPRCSALCFSNTLPFGKHPTWVKETSPVDWKGIFGTDDPKESPIARRFPGFAGGLSGAPLLPFVIEWVRAVRALSITTPINAGGGILSGNDAGHVFDEGADSIFLGSIAMLAPTQVQKTIQTAHNYVRLRQRKLGIDPRAMTYNV
ncbi:MAG: hypothetical protein COV91_03225 [Candidatus Taylorbacteria bacterium CG11_big_fil_rev_8_21_14_0_20_46_11]|uniref:Dihydroorotate dehydrogenase catalytic domain-containing protein n=1 Tax=Candidatus Taylorbacteria bacterium CG11_big_fil_rev_8_21_14_0_20_46_11 TaxID=1975025 RepID=A0A2H0KBH9_9BACT|nr:MAG: hypothetical protein COV91_03225 [Candidatus Taylorbacteria bacterium CG11_big_fil_rev_8_21_14_0_20_46_11]